MRRSLFQNARYWDLKAEEARAVADVMQTTVAREIMLRIAAGYDQLAEHARENQQKDKAA